MPQLAQRLTVMHGQGLYNLYLRPLSGSKVVFIFLLYTTCNRGKYARLGPRLQSIALKPMHSFDKHSQRFCSFAVLWWALQRLMGQMQNLHSGIQTAGPQDHVVRVYHSRHFTYANSNSYNNTAKYMFFPKFYDEQCRPRDTE